MDYQEALSWIMSFWELGRPKEEKALRHLKVPRMRRLLALLGSPHRKYPAVLVAGTKGKGSTVAFVAEGLRAAGFRVGRYTQPHLVDWRERTWVDGRWIDQEAVADLVSRVKPAVEALHAESPDLGAVTTYEVGTALTLSHFADQRVDVAVLEIGVGGRLDALNAVEPVLSAVTSISLDHTDVLGETLREIATEKAGIMRPGKPVVVAPQPLEAEITLRQVAAEKGATLYRVGREPGDRDWWWTEDPARRTIDIHGPWGELRGVRVALLGDHQRDNATVAVASLQLLREQGFRVPDEAIHRGLAGVEWPGRVQRLQSSPLVVVDAAHNRESARRFLETIRKEFWYRRLILVFGASADKDIPGMAAELGPAADELVVTGSGHRRAAGLDRLAAEFSPYGRVRQEAEPADAFRQALMLAHRDDLVLVTGSVFLAGRAIQTFGGRGMVTTRTRRTRRKRAESSE